MSLKDKKTRLQQLVNQAKTEYAALEAKEKGGAEVTQEERNKLLALLDDGKALRREVVALEEMEAADAYLNQPAAPRKSQAGAQGGERKSWGQRVLASEQFKAARKGSTAESPRMEGVNVKALYGSSDAAGGVFVQAQREVEVVQLPQRRTSVLNLINVSETTSDAVEFARQTVRVNNAAPVAEFEDGNFGLKPEGTLAWEMVTTNVKTIAEWVRVSRRILQDAPRLQNAVDVDLTQQLAVALETQIVSGNGVGENFLGILLTPGILTRTQGAGARAEVADTVADTVRRGITDVELQFYEPNGVVLNPVEVETLELEKDTDGQYIKIMDPATGRLWRLPVTSTPAVAQGTGIVGDLKMAATLWDRMETEIRVGEPLDFFLRNALAVLGELRAAFAVTRPSAVEKLTFT